MPQEYLEASLLAFLLIALIHFHSFFFFDMGSHSVIQAVVQ